MIDQASAKPRTGTEPPAPHVHVFDLQGRLLRSLAIPAGGLSVGRLPDSSLVLQDASVSRKHVQIVWDNGRVRVRDLGSKGGSLLGEQPLVPNADTVWDFDQPLYVGPYRLELTFTAVPPVFGLAPVPAPVARSVAPPPVAPPPAPVPAPVIAVPVALDPAPTAALAAPLEPELLEPELPPPSPAVPPSLALMPGQELLTIFPGQSAAVSLAITNQGTEDDAYVVSVDGMPAGWVYEPTQAVPVAPGAQALLPLSIDVPRAFESLAGEYPITIRARSMQNPSAIGVVQARWNVQLFGESALELTPRRAEGRERASYVLHIANRGNSISGYQLSASDEDELLNVVFADPEPTLDPGQELDVPLTVLAPTRLIGSPRRHSFTVTAATPDEAPLTSAAQFVSLARVPLWALPLLLALLLVPSVLLGLSLLAPPEPQINDAGAQQTASVIAASATAAQAELDISATAIAQTGAALALAPPQTQTALAPTLAAQQTGLALAETARANELAVLLTAVVPPTLPAGTVLATGEPTVAPPPTGTTGPGTPTRTAQAGTTPSPQASGTVQAATATSTADSATPTVGTPLPTALAEISVVAPSALTYSTRARQLALRAQAFRLGEAATSGTIAFTLNISSTTLSAQASVNDGVAQTTLSLPAGAPAGEYQINASYSDAGVADAVTASSVLRIAPATVRVAVTSAEPAALGYADTQRNLTLRASVNATSADAGAVSIGEVVFTVRLSEGGGTADFITASTPVGRDGTAGLSINLPQANANEGAGYQVTARYVASRNFAAASSDDAGSRRVRITRSVATLNNESTTLDGTSYSITVVARSGAAEVPGIVAITQGCAAATASLSNGRASFTGCALNSSFTISYSDPNYQAAPITVTTGGLQVPPSVTPTNTVPPTPTNSQVPPTPTNSQVPPSPTSTVTPSPTSTVTPSPTSTVTPSPTSTITPSPTNTTGLPAPEAPVINAPPEFNTIQKPVIGGTGETGATINLTITGPEIVTCEIEPVIVLAGSWSCKPKNNLEDGVYTITATQTRGILTSPASLPRSFTVDRTKPTGNITAKPNNPTGSKTATFEFTGTDATSGVASFECSLDDGPFAPCASGVQYTVAEGNHKFDMRVIDRAGNRSNANLHNWTVN